MRGADQIDLARVDHDEFCAFTQALLHARCEDRVSIGWVGTNEQNDVGVFDRLEVLGAGGSAEGIAQSKPVGEWHTRAHVSTLLFPNAARTIFCTTNTSSLVQRDELIAPIESKPCLA